MTIPAAPAPMPPGGQLPGGPQGAGAAAGPGGPAAAAGAPQADPAGAAFGQQMAPNATNPAAQPAQVNTVQFPDGTNLFDQASGVRQEITRIRADLERQVKAGKIDPTDSRINMWRLMDLQTRAQDMHFRVELMSSLVKEAGSSVKRISETPAG